MENELQQTRINSYPANQFPAIVCTASLVNGSPRLAGRLISVREVVSAIVNTNDLELVADEFQLTILQIRQAVQYCSSQQCRQDEPNEFCDKCSLRREQKGALNISCLNEITFDNITYIQGEDFLYLGTMEELLEDWEGKDWWLVAANSLIKFRKFLFR